MTRPPDSVAGVHARVGDYLGTRARGVGLRVAFAGLCFFLALAWLVAGPDGWRPGSWAPLLLDALALAAVAGGVVAFRRWRARLVAERPVSAAIERAADLPAGLVQGVLELGRTIPPGVSASLVVRSAAHLAAHIGRPPALLAGDLGRRAAAGARRAGWGLAVALPLLALLLLLEPVVHYEALLAVVPRRSEARAL
ncbi:MAG: hypothetical protein RQ751_13615, partial [Longimicrobiales bacterium]|nr:hypothetical protein [Longimicrobiales bacterium]